MQAEDRLERLIRDLEISAIAVLSVRESGNGPIIASWFREAAKEVREIRDGLMVAIDQEESPVPRTGEPELV